MASRVVFFLSVLNLSVLFVLYMKVETLGALATRQSQQSWFATRDVKERQYRQWAEEDATAPKVLPFSTHPVSSASKVKTMASPTTTMLSNSAALSSATPTPTSSMSASSSDSDEYPTPNFTIIPTMDQTSTTTAASSDSPFSGLPITTRMPYSSSYSGFLNTTASFTASYKASSSRSGSPSNGSAVRALSSTSYVSDVSSSLMTSTSTISVSASTHAPKSITNSTASYIGSGVSPQRSTAASEPTSVKKAIIGRYNTNDNRKPAHHRGGT